MSDITIWPDEMLWPKNKALHMEERSTQRRWWWLHHVDVHVSGRSVRINKEVLEENLRPQRPQTGQTLLPRQMTHSYGSKVEEWLWDECVNVQPVPGATHSIKPDRSGKESEKSWCAELVASYPKILTGSSPPRSL